MKKINWISRCRILWWILLKKDLLENIKSSKSFLDPENYQCCHQEPYNFFSIFVGFWTLPDNSGIPKSVDSKLKISCNRVIFFHYTTGKVFGADRKKSFFRYHYWWVGISNYIYSTISVITEICIFLFYFQFCYW